MMTNRCKDCKHAWLDEEIDDIQHYYCLRIPTEGEYKPGDVKAFAEGYGNNASLIVSGDFGCVEFESKKMTIRGEVMLTVEHKIKRQILRDMLRNLGSSEGDQVVDADNKPLDFSLAEDIERLYSMARYCEGVFVDVETLDEEAKFRCSGEETNLPSESSPHYECVRVAKKLDCGASVSWLYWHGGGKYGEPDSIEWMSEECGAYEVECIEKEKIVKIRTYTKKV